MTLLAIVAIHTAANELPKVRQVMNKVHRNVGGRSTSWDPVPAVTTTTYAVTAAAPVASLPAPIPDQKLPPGLPSVPFHEWTALKEWCDE